MSSSVIDLMNQIEELEKELELAKEQIEHYIEKIEISNSIVEKLVPVDFVGGYHMTFGTTPNGWSDIESLGITKKQYDYIKRLKELNEIKF